MLGTEFNLHTKSGNDDIVMVIPTVDLNTDVSMGKTSALMSSSSIAWDCVSLAWAVLADTTRKKYVHRASDEKKDLALAAFNYQTDADLIVEGENPYENFYDPGLILTRLHKQRETSDTAKQAKNI